MKKLFFLLGLISFAFTVNEVESGSASYYGKKFHGRKTASGERYDNNRYTAAHRKHPFGTILKVTHAESRDTVLVRVNDRGPFVRGRIIDVSWCAARDLNILRAGHAKVEVEVVEGYDWIDGKIVGKDTADKVPKEDKNDAGD